MRGAESTEHPASVNGAHYGSVAERRKTGPDGCSDVGSHTLVSVKVEPKVTDDGHWQRIGVLPTRTGSLGI